MRWFSTEMIPPVRHSAAFAGGGFSTTALPRTLPWRRVGSLARNAGEGSGAFRAVALDDGVIVRRPGVLSRHSKDLADELWRLTDAGRVNGFAATEAVLVLPRCYSEPEPSVVIVDARSGREIARHPMVAESWLAVFAADVDAFVMGNWGSPDLRAYRVETGEELWRVPFESAAAMASGERVVVASRDGKRVIGLDARSGERAWELEIPNESELPRGQPHLTLIDEETILVVALDGQLLRVSLAKGDILAQGHGFAGGAFAVTDTTIVYSGADGIAALDHRSMTLVERVDWAADLAPLYGPAPRSTCDVFVGTDSVVWTTMHGVVMGMPRAASSDGRKPWTDALPQVFFPIGVGFFANATHAYCIPAAAKGDPPGLYAYETTPPD